MGAMSIDYDEMANAAEQLRGEEENFETCVTNMQATIENLKDVWVGETSTKYAEQFEDLQPSFESTKELIEALASQIDSIVETVQETDSGMASKVGVNN